MYSGFYEDSENSQHALKNSWLLERDREIERGEKEKPHKPQGEIVSWALLHNLFCSFLHDGWAERIHIVLARSLCTKSALTSLKGRVNRGGGGVAGGHQNDEVKFQITLDVCLRNNR